MRTTGHLASTHAVDWFGQCSGHACVGHAFSAPMDWRHGRAVVGECRRMAWMGCPGSGHECGAASGVARPRDRESEWRGGGKRNRAGHAHSIGKHAILFCLPIFAQAPHTKRTTRTQETRLIITSDTYVPSPVRSRTRVQTDRRVHSRTFTLVSAQLQLVRSTGHDRPLSYRLQRSSLYRWQFGARWGL